MLASNTPLISIRHEDVRQLVIDNPRDTKLEKNKLADLLSNNVTEALFSANHSSLNEVVQRVDEKRRRRQSHSSIFKTAAHGMGMGGMARLEGQNTVSVTHALPSITDREGTKFLNARSPTLGTIKEGRLSGLTASKAQLQYRVRPVTPEVTKENRYD